jgi:autotransporter-associated beta strand protein
MITGVTLTNPGQNYQAGDVLNFSFAGGGPLAVAPTFNYVLQVADMSLNSAGGLNKLGSGTLILSANSTYVGATNVISGTLQVDGSFGNTPVNVGPNGTLAGKGTIANAGSNAVAVSGGIAPGSPASNATLTTGPMTWNGGGDYLWKVSQLPTGSPTSGAGTNWDEINFSALTISATASSPFTITPVGTPPGILPGQAYTWQIAQIAAGGGGAIAGFNVSNFVLNTAQFAGGAYPPSDFTLSASGSAIDLTLGYSPAPEPSSFAMTVLATASLLPRKRRCRL